MRRIRKHIVRKNKTRKGAGITQSRPKYPPLPETPTEKPQLPTNNEGLMHPPKESEEYQKRAKRLRNTFNKARHQSLKSIILGKKRQEVPRDLYGPIASHFPITNSGFKP